MHAYQQRVVDEKEDLDGKLSRLKMFLADAQGTIAPIELGRLKAQADIMDQYSAILADRIASFPGS